jgi:hypothetical protein
MIGTGKERETMSASNLFVGFIRTMPCSSVFLLISVSNAVRVRCGGYAAERLDEEDEAADGRSG